MSAQVRKSVLRMHGYVPGEQPRDPDLIKLNTNENPYPPSPRVAEALGAIDASRLARYPDPVALPLRERIAGLHNCDVNQVFAGNGSDEVLALCTRAFVENDGSIGFFDISYSLYPVLAEIRDVMACPIELGGDFGWRTPETCDCSLFFLTNPNAPTGILYPKEEVAAFCRRSRGVVVIDEAYGDFARDNCMDLALSESNVLVLRTLSKAYSLAGLRLGYAVGASLLIEALFKIKDSYNLPAITQILAGAALSDGEHMRKNVARIRATRARLTESLTELGFHVFPSETNFLWARPPGMAAADMFLRLRERHILVRHFAGEKTGEFLRITVGNDREIDAFMNAVRDILSV